MKILFVTRRVPYPPNKGDTLLVYNLAKTLNQVDDTYCLTIGGGDEDKLGILEEKGIFKHADKVGIRENISPSPIIRNSNVLNKKVEQLVEEKGIDIVHCHGHTASMLLSNLSHRKVSVILDSRSLFQKRYIHNNINNGTVSPRDIAVFAKWLFEEFYIGLKYDNVVAVSDSDASFIEKISIGANVWTIPNGIDYKRFDPSKVRKKDAVGSDIILHGNMDFSPNIDSAEYLCNQVMPLVWDKYPDTTVNIVGSNPTERVRKLQDHEKVTVTGFVKDIRRYIKGSEVEVVLMREGSGLKNKILEALSMHTPVIANKMSSASIPKGLKKYIYIRDNIYCIAETIIEVVYGQKGLKWGEEVRDKIRFEHSWDSVAEEYRTVYQSGMDLTRNV